MLLDSQRLLNGRIEPQNARQLSPFVMILKVGGFWKAVRSLELNILPLSAEFLTSATT